ncbi:arabinosyltransferase [Saccharopolyspora rhizosphaerae]|uniref:Arabinosyltransferase n=1 Tax=Saccharopolyspora rhizosphaerae TaxID=2492662 RepID=A0A3R8QA34_9PSEU|nr:arabinosyltransferase domain-containing protein [Saccharopolyspora rhizosphaerae]RRO20381.1 arabinosyltransferase [Saccharopolyspora rhizosphaerae]
MSQRSTRITRRDPVRRRAGAVAAVLGLLSAVLAVAVPLLPVNHDVTTLTWPTAQGTRSVSAPLVSHAPLWLNATVPCASARSLDTRTNGPAELLATNAPSGTYGSLTGMNLQVERGQVTLFARGHQLGEATLPAGDCAITIKSDAAETRADIAGVPLGAVGGDQRPQVTGIYSQLDEGLDEVRGLEVQARVDTRFATTPTALKTAAMVLAVLCFLGSMVALRKLEVRAPVRWLPSGWWRLGVRDLVVFTALALWWLIGAMTADDGYILTMLRAAPDAGYVTNYFRWFGNPESPFGWFYEFYAVWVQVSAATPWVRLPALFLGVISWLLLSRGVLPRLGQQVRRSSAAGWAAAAVFLAFWLPYNNGLRPEPVVVVFFLLAVCAVERAVATERLTPAALGLLAAALGLGANPHGMVAVLPFLVGAKPLLRLLSQRIRANGALPVLAPIGAAGLVILVGVFFDQTWQSVMDSIDLKTEMGPNDSWYEELGRYEKLFDKWPDGSLTRRFPVLLLLLCIAASGVVFLRRGKIRGAALGPSRRMLGLAVLSFVVLAATPTKHTHHFGVFAAIGAVLAALTALATSAAVLRSRRNRAGFFAGLMVVCALSVTGTNSWWYVSGWGVPWFDKAPSLDGRHASSAFLALGFLALVVAFVEHVRHDEPPVITPTARKRVLRLGAAPLTITCALCLVAEVGLFTVGIEKQRGSYSLGPDNVKQIAGRSCGLSDYINVEPDPRRGVLAPSPNQPRVPSNSAQPPDYLQDELEGFHRFGFPPDPQFTPPFGYGGDDAPVWGTFDTDASGTGEVRTPWYDLPPQVTEGTAPVVVQFAGSSTNTNSMRVEWGRDVPGGFEVTGHRDLSLNSGTWQDQRFEPRGATKVRIVAADHRADPEGWLAFSAPRVPVLTTMTDLIGSQPTFVEWPAALVHPCLEPAKIRDGVFEMPRFRVAGGGIMRDMGQSWSAPAGGGPFGWLNVGASVRKLPAHLQGSPNRDWGAIYVVDPYDSDTADAGAAMRVHRETHWGDWSPGPLTEAVKLPGRVPTSEGRTDLRPVEPAVTGDES